MIKILAHIYYVGQIITYGGLTIWALYMALRGLFNGSPAFINICFVAMTLSSCCLLYAPSMRDYRSYKARHKQPKTAKNGNN